MTEKDIIKEAPFGWMYVALNKHNQPVEYLKVDINECWFIWYKERWTPSTVTNTRMRSRSDVEFIANNYNK